MTAEVALPAGRAPSPHPLGALLPSLYLNDTFAQSLCASLDEVLGPVISVLDCFPAYLDPATTPPDMLDWLASWTGLAAARSLPVGRRRRLVTRAAALHAWRGTPAAVQELVELASGHRVELEESGGVGWSRDAGTPLPGNDRPGLVVRVHSREPTQGGAYVDPSEDGRVDMELLARMLELVVPAHLPWRLELVT